MPRRTRPVGAGLRRPPHRCRRVYRGLRHQQRSSGDMLKEFKEFAMRGNVIDLAVGIIIGGAFGRITSSLVTDVIMPPIGLLLGSVDFSSLFINRSGRAYTSLTKATRTSVASGT